MFQTYKASIEKNIFAINEIARTIEESHIVLLDSQPDELLDLQEFFDRIEKKRLEVVESLVFKYRQIAPLLCKIEEVVAGTNSGKAPIMREFYEYVEMKIYTAIVKMTLSGMEAFSKFLGLSGRKDSRRARIKVSALLHPPDVLISPALNEIHKTVGKLLKNCADSSKSFVRWLRYSCVETPPQPPPSEEEEPIIFSFYSDVSVNQSVIKMMLSINQSLQKTFVAVDRRGEPFKKYFQLWKDDRAASIEKFAKRVPSNVAYDEHLSHYQHISRSAERLPTEAKIGFLHVSYANAIQSIRSEAQTWIDTIGRYLHDSSFAIYSGIKDKVGKYHEELKRVPDSLDELKTLLNAITEILDVSAETERAITDVCERYRTLSLYGVTVDAAELESVLLLREEWRQLTEAAKVVSLSITGTKKKFVAVTRQQIEGFQVQSNEVLKDLLENGPASNKMELDNAAEILRKYIVSVVADAKLTLKGDMAEKKQSRDQLVLAQKLFDMEMVKFGDFAKAEDIINLLGMIINLYVEFKEAEKQWSGTLFFGQLDTQALASSWPCHSSSPLIPQMLRRLPSVSARLLPMRRDMLCSIKSEMLFRSSSSRCR